MIKITTHTGRYAHLSSYCRKTQDGKTTCSSAAKLDLMNWSFPPCSSINFAVSWGTYCEYCLNRSHENAADKDSSWAYRDRGTFIEPVVALSIQEAGR